MMEWGGAGVLWFGHFGLFFASPSYTFSLFLCRSFMVVVSLGMSALAPGVTRSLFLLLCSGCKALSLIFFPHSSTGWVRKHLSSVFCLFLNKISPRHHHLGCWAQPCPRCVGWSQLPWPLLTGAASAALLSVLGHATQYIVILKLRVSYLRFSWGHGDAGYSMNELL